MNEHTDEQLITLFREGRHDAFNELVRRHQDRVFWTIRRLVGDDDDAYDIAQDVFIKVFTHAHRFRGDAQVFTWLYRIATNLSINHLRKRKLRTFFHVDDVLGLEDPDPSPREQVERQEVRDRIDRAIRRLPDKQRAVFILRYYDELPYEEIARILHRSVGGLKANYFHAARKMEEYLRNEL
jgi:RNA polymerase sigma factor (sigma-70 family)